jgi:hypothetical protein
VSDAADTIAETGICKRWDIPSRSPSFIQVDKSEEGISDVINTRASGGRRNRAHQQLRTLQPKQKFQLLR